MRLPQRVRTGVQRFAREDIQGTLASANAISRATGSLQQLAGNIIAIDEEARQAKTNEQIRNAGLTMAERMMEFEEKYAGRESIPVSEIPESVQIRRTEKVANPDGTISERMREEVPAYEVMPELFKSYAGTQLEAASSTIEDESARDLWARESKLKIDESYVTRLSNSRQQQFEYTQNKVVTDVELAINNGNYDIARDLLDSISDDNLRKRYAQNIDFSQAVDYYNDLIIADDANPDDITDAIAELRDPDIKSPLSDEQRLAKAKALEQNLLRVTASAREQTEKERQLLVSDTWLQIDEGDPNVDEAYVDTLFNNGQINGDTRTAMMRGLDRQRNIAVERVVTQTDLDMIASKGYGIDPKDKKAREAVDFRYEQYVQSSEDPWGSATRIMEEFKVVPSNIMSMFRSANRADAPNLAQAVELFIDAQDHAPESLADFNSSDINFIEDVAANVRLGMDVNGAVEAVRSWNSLSPQQRTALNINSQSMVENNNESLMNQISDHPAYDIPWSVSDPQPNAFMTQEYQALVQRYLPSVGFNVAVAQTKAFGELAKSWRLTDINGDYALMKHMPSAPTDEIRTEIKNQYTGRLGQFREFYGRDFKYKDVSIYSDALTQIQLNNGEKPTYVAYLMVDRENGIIEELPRFTWDADAVAERRRAKLLEEAQLERTKFMEQMKRRESIEEIQRRARELQWSRKTPYQR